MPAFVGAAEHIGTKTTVQIRSHAQKFFSKAEKDKRPHRAGPSQLLQAVPAFAGAVPVTLLRTKSLHHMGSSESTTTAYAHVRDPDCQPDRNV